MHFQHTILLQSLVTYSRDYKTRRHALNSLLYPFTGEDTSFDCSRLNTLAVNS